jgi:preprotein translocase subunit SecF
MINWMKYRWLYLLISGSLIIFGIFSMIKWGFAIGLDFTGGSFLEYSLPDGSVKTFRSKFIDQTKKAEIKTNLEKEVGGTVTEIRFENVGPTIGPEMVKKTFYALLISTIAILLWIAYQFKNFKFGISATLATIHDSLIVIGSFSILGHFFGAEVDFLFVTAVLTTLSFSVHDTIVVFDRIREMRKGGFGDISEYANTAISETMVRSLNNSFTIIFMLLALILLGGDTIKWFAVALLIGTVFGTYSSPFVAVSLLVTWDEISKKLSLRKNKSI